MLEGTRSLGGYRRRPQGPEKVVKQLERGCNFRKLVPMGASASGLRAALGAFRCSGCSSGAVPKLILDSPEVILEPPEVIFGHPELIRSSSFWFPRFFKIHFSNRAHVGEPRTDVRVSQRRFLASASGFRRSSSSNFLSKPACQRSSDYGLARHQDLRIYHW